MVRIALVASVLTTLLAATPAFAETIIWNSPRVELPEMAPAAGSAHDQVIRISYGQPAAAAHIDSQVRSSARIGMMQAVYNPAQAGSSELFGRASVMSNDITAFSKWTQVIERQQAELVAQRTPTTQSWLDFLESLRGLPQQAQINAVNDYVNKVAYVEDTQNYGQQDYWATPEEFFARGGDCEDYAIAKYVSLQLLGIDVSRMRVVILFDQNKQLRHAVLAVQDTGDMKILDNQSDRVLAASQIDHYLPIYAISQQGWWRFV